MYAYKIMTEMLENVFDTILSKAILNNYVYSKDEFNRVTNDNDSD